jgi:hypothetical protein
MVQKAQELLMKSFKQYLEENRLAMLAAAGLASGAMAAPPKPEAVERMVQYMKEKEGFRATAERDKDATGKPVVVGYGTTHTYPDTGAKIQLGDRITPEKAEEHIRTYFKNMTPHMEKIPGWDEMDAGKQSALMSFGYNFGPAFYKPNAKPNESFYSISQDLKNKNWDNVPKSLSLYNKSGGKVLGGLVTRRKMEGDMWRGTSTPTPTQQNQQTQTQNSHTVAKGDSLSRIAEKHGTTIENLQKLNPHITDVNKINIGVKIKTK